MCLDLKSIKKQRSYGVPTDRRTPRNYDIDGIIQPNEFSDLSKEVSYYTLAHSLPISSSQITQSVNLRWAI